MWSWLSEGGAHIVFSYTGDYEKELTGKVLRISKISGNQSLEHVSRQIDHYNRVCTAHFGPLWAMSLKPFRLEKSIFQKILKLSAGKRHHERLKTPIEVTSENQVYGILSDDYSHPHFIELKLKWGGSTASPCHKRESITTSPCQCRYCRHYRLDYKIEEPRYCPSRLLSCQSIQQISECLESLRLHGKPNQFKTNIPHDNIELFMEVLCAFLLESKVLECFDRGVRERFKAGDALTAASIQDCSFIFTFEGEKIAKAAVLDLDIKPAHKLDYYKHEHDLPN